MPLAEVNLLDSEITIDGQTGKIDKWVVEFLAPCGIFDAPEKIPESDRPYAIPVPVAYSGELKAICATGYFEDAIVGDSCPDSYGHESSGEIDGDPDYHQPYVGGD